MALKLGYNNILGGYGGSGGFTFSGSSNDDLENLIDPDHSTTFSGNGGTIDFGDLYPTLDSGESYAVCISGLAKTSTVNSSSLNVKIFDDTTLIDQTNLRDRAEGGCVFFTFNATGSLNLKIQLSQPFIVSYVAMVFLNTNEMSEQSGYARNHFVTHRKTATTTNLLQAPVSSIIQNKKLKGALSLPNANEDLTGELFNIFNFGIQSTMPFFIREDDTDPQSAYCCFDPVLDVRAHSQTRLLNSIKLSFNVFNGGF